MSEDLQWANEEIRQAWNQNVAFWDERIGEGEGNHFVEVLIWPATERLLEPCPGDRVLDNISLIPGAAGVPTTPGCIKQTG